VGQAEFGHFEEGGVMRRSRTAISIAIGSIVLGGGVLATGVQLFAAARQPVSIGEPPIVQAAPLPATSPSIDVAPPTPSSPFATTAPRGAMDPTAWPSRVLLPALAVEAPIQPIGLEATGALVIPTSPMDVGWYQRSSVPGTAGVALLTSHVDTRLEGRGIFSRLADLALGDDVHVVTAEGVTQRWQVVAIEQHRKDELPPSLFVRSGEPLLALVTCAGPFDPVARSYRDNLIVWARPAST